MRERVAAAEGDLVWIHLHSKRSPDALGTALTLGGDLAYVADSA